MRLVFALIIKLQDCKPIIHKQLREGKDDAYFICFTLRSMRSNDDAEYSRAIVHDPSVIRFGMFVRKPSLDEFPQFFKVF